MPKANKTVSRTIRIDVETDRLIDLLVVRFGENISVVVRRAIREFAERSLK